MRTRTWVHLLGVALLAGAAPAPGRQPAVAAQGVDPVAFTNEVFHRTNAERTARGLPVFNRDARLDRSAAAFSQYMGEADFIGHVGPNGVTLDRRMRAQGYNWSYWGENIAWGDWTPAELVAAWMASAPHRANILNSNLRDMGVGVATFPFGATRYGMYVTQDFGAQRATLPPPPAPAGWLTVSTQNLVFPPTLLRRTATLSLTLRNVGKRTVTGTIGSLRSPYSVMRGGPFNLAAGAAQTISVRFTPTVRGTAPTTTLTISAPSANSVSVRVSGSGR